MQLPPVTLEPDNLRQAQQLIAQLRDLLPNLISLNPKDRQRIPKAGTKSQGFIEQALAIAADRPDLLPASFDRDRFLHDATLLDPLLSLQAEMLVLFGCLNDTTLVTRASVMQSSLQIYRMLKAQAKLQPELAAYIQAMSRRFDRRPGTGPAEESGPPLPA